MTIRNDEEYELRDPIYGFITFNELEKDIINHPAFQRLRRIKQMGLTDYVYPSASHSRFEHSIGVMHYSSLMFDSIVGKEESAKIITDELGYKKPEETIKRIRQLIRVAALCHDLGHTAFSHSLEIFLPKNKFHARKKHEDYSSAIVRTLLKDTIEKSSLNKYTYNITSEQVASFLEESPKEKEDVFWKMILSGEIDADRGDYLLRDCHHIGVKYGVYDYSRLINTLILVKDPESGEVIIGVNEDGWHSAESLLIARYKMYVQVNFHKTRRAYEYHLKQIIEKIYKKKTFPGINDLEKFIEIDDSTIINKIKELKKDENYQPIIEKRNHIRKIFESSEFPSVTESQKIERMKESLRENKIWFYSEIFDESWYKKDIMIFSKMTQKVRPLSDYSNIIKNIKRLTQVRIYTKLEYREQAESVINRIANEGV